MAVHLLNVLHEIWALFGISVRHMDTSLHGRQHHVIFLQRFVQILDLGSLVPLKLLSMLQMLFKVPTILPQLLLLLIFLLFFLFNQIIF